MEHSHTRSYPQHRFRIAGASHADQIYHLRFGTEARRPLFSAWPAARAVVCALRDREARGHAQSWAVLVMPDHVDWPCSLENGSTLPELLARVKDQTTERLRTLGVLGPVWHDGYSDRALGDEEQMQAVARHLVSDPVRQGVVAFLGDCPHWDAAWLRGGEAARR